MGIVKHSLTIAGHRTSVSLEEPFWTAFRALAAARGLSVNALAREIDAARIGAGGEAEYTLSSAIRLAVLAHCRESAPADGNGATHPDHDSDSSSS